MSQSEPLRSKRQLLDVPNEAEISGPRPKSPKITESSSPSSGQVCLPGTEEATTPLCSSCANIKFGYLAKRAPEFGHTLAKIARPGQLRAAALSCQFCPMLDWLLEPHRTTDDGLQEVLLTYSRAASQMRFGVAFRSSPGVESSFKGVISLRNPAVTDDRWWDSGISARFIGVAASQDDAMAHWMDLGRVDYNIIRNAIDRLRPDNGPSAEQVRLKLRVIDCLTLELTTIAEYTPYAALSYVWGLKQPGDIVASQRLDLGSAPSTITSAIEVAIRLGYHYLWIDRYCIDQSNPHEKHSIIQQMGRIYQNARVTICATAGSDPEYGLPGVGQCHRKPALHRNIQGHRLTSLPENPQGVIERSTWMSRGWTYQEACLSTLRCFFTDEQIYLETASDTFEECFGDDVRVYNDNSLFAPPSHRVPIYSLISEYSKRKMSFETDYLNGFLGVLEVLQQTRHVWGMPLEYRSNNIEVENQLAHSMSWEATLGGRRPHFPSWSWVGWTGTISGPPARNFGSKYFLDYIHLDRSASLETDQTIDEFFSDTNPMPTEMPRVLKVRCGTFRARIVHVVESNEQARDKFYRLQRGRLVFCPLPPGYFVTWEDVSGFRVCVSCKMFRMENEWLASDGHDIQVAILVGDILDPIAFDRVSGRLLLGCSLPCQYETIGAVDFKVESLYFESRPPQSLVVDALPSLEPLLPRITQRETIWV